jgi:hypothetical protein
VDLEGPLSCMCADSSAKYVDDVVIPGGGGLWIGWGSGGGLLLGNRILRYNACCVLGVCLL